MGKKDVDSFSSTSGRSRSSMERRKRSRFSLQRLFSSGRSMSLSTPRPQRMVRSAEIESRSVSSLHGSPTDKEVTLQNTSSDESNSCSSTSAMNKYSKDCLECPLCLVPQPRESFPVIMTCHHRSCKDCLKQYLRIEITESRVNIACPECAEKFHPNDIKMILEDEKLMAKYEEFMLRRILVIDPDTRWCPAPDCGYAVIAAGCASCPKIRCKRSGCDTYFCYHCKQYWHPNQTCDAARAERSSNLRSSSISYSHDSNSGEIKPCPRCGAFIIKMDDGSCNHMTCAVCGAEFCWLCMKEISDLHYLSPSGCTFWGKKPWSRKKKILWQLGTLVGAPLGISLIAGIAVPAIIIGVPVWVGRKLHAKYEHASKHKRNLIITGGVTASVLVSPIFAGLAVGIGVPILLAYVYGVVPISLCRSGGCGVTTTNAGGVRFDFDEEQEGSAGVTGPFAATADTQSAEMASHNVANPSIGPSIGEMSVGMTNSLSASGSHIDRVGIIREDSADRDSASNRAIAGASLNGSLCEGAASAYHNRLEVQADVATGSGLQKRASLSSESANFSLDAKSATVSFGDDASTKALAGSICNRDKDNTSAIIPPLEVQIDVMAASAQYHSHGEPAIHRPSGGHGSPTSSRSVSFVDGEVPDMVAHRRSFKHQSLSIGDSIHEQSEKSSEILNSQGYTDDSSLDVSSQGSTHRLISTPQRSPCHKGVMLNSCPQDSSSAESMSSPDSSPLSGSGALGLPEVECNRPRSYTFDKLAQCSTSQESTSTETVGYAKDGPSTYKHNLVLSENCLAVGSDKETTIRMSLSSGAFNEDVAPGSLEKHHMENTRKLQHCGIAASNGNSNSDSSASGIYETIITMEDLSPSSSAL